MHQKFLYHVIAMSAVLFVSEVTAYQAPPLDRPKFIPTENPRDHDITEELRQSIKDDYYAAPYYDQITIQTQNGVVLLTGTIDSNRIKLVIEQKARRIRGVSRVDDQIQINSTPPYVPPL